VTAPDDDELALLKAKLPQLQMDVGIAEQRVRAAHEELEMAEAARIAADMAAIGSYVLDDVASAVDAAVCAGGGRLHRARGGEA
jgi:hypothetical protein